MRPKVVEYLNGLFGTDIFTWLVPYPAFVYSMMMLLGMWLFVKRCKNSGLSQQRALMAAIWTLLGGLIGARLFYLLIYHDLYGNFLKELVKINGATISWGAYLGGFAAMMIFLLIFRLHILRYLDVVGSVMGIGPFIGRWSCFLNGCDFGKISNDSWAITYPHGSIPFVNQVRVGILDPMAASSFPVHPVPIYFSIIGLILFIIFTYLWKNSKFPNGTIFFGYWATDSLIRFFIEFLRGDTQIFYWGVFSIGQVMTFIVFIISVSGLLVIFSKHWKTSKVVTH
jgi:phosphatidylglycerol---prolipoprotein diacylglyceryl transferase